MCARLNLLFLCDFNGNFKILMIIWEGYLYVEVDVKWI